MDIENIKGIMADKVWKKIKRNKGYRGYTIIDADCKPSKKRTSGSFFVLMVFFTIGTKKKTLLEYHKQGRKVKKRNGYEMLDNTFNFEFYGNMQTLTFS